MTELVAPYPSIHTDQYLNFMSHHPIDHKMSVVRTLLERSQNLVSEPEDKKKEDIHVQDALRTCGYPEWSFQKAICQIKQMKPKKKKKQDVAVTRPSVVIPYVEKVSETAARIMKKYNVLCDMKPWVTLKNVLVHPKDCEDKEQTTKCVYPRFHVPAVRRPTLARQEGNLGSGYKNTDLKWSRKRIELLPEVIVQVHRLNLIDRHYQTTQSKRNM